MLQVGSPGCIKMPWWRVLDFGMGGFGEKILPTPEQSILDKTVQTMGYGLYGCLAYANEFACVKI